MSQHSTSDQAMQEYLTALLEEEQPHKLDELTRLPLEKMLAEGMASHQAAQAEAEALVEAALSSAVTAPEPEPKQVPKPDPEPVSAEKIPPPDVPTFGMEDYQSESFQALFFTVAGLNLAVPLKSLGGIHNWQAPKPLFGRPAWYLGIMPHREAQLNVVDTACWVMPEKYTEALAESLDYQYLVMLGESHWGLACEKLVNTVTLEPEQVQWRQGGGKRPWLGGIVKEKMCALLNVEALIDLLEKGLDNSQNKGNKANPTESP